MTVTMMTVMMVVVVPLAQGLPIGVCGVLFASQILAGFGLVGPGTLTRQ